MEGDNKKLTMAVIAGAAHALKYKSRHPRASDEETIQYITNQSVEILKKIDE